MMSANNQPDWNSMAEKFDMWLPQIAPVGDLLIEALDVNPGDKVLEIGPGLGPLTELLLERAEEILAIETDERLVKILTENRLTHQRLYHCGVTFPPKYRHDKRVRF